MHKTDGLSASAWTSARGAAHIFGPRRQLQEIVKYVSGVSGAPPGGTCVPSEVVRDEFDLSECSYGPYYHDLVTNGGCAKLLSLVDIPDRYRAGGPPALRPPEVRRGNQVASA